MVYPLLSEYCSQIHFAKYFSVILLGKSIFSEPLFGQESATSLAGAETFQFAIGWFKNQKISQIRIEVYLLLPMLNENQKNI